MKRTRESDKGSDNENDKGETETEAEEEEEDSREETSSSSYSSSRSCSTCSSEESDSEGEEVTSRYLDRKKLVPGDHIDLDYTFNYLSHQHSIEDMIVLLMPPTTQGTILDLFKRPSKQGNKQACKLWYDAWFYLCDPHAGFEDIFNSCVAALAARGEPKSYKINYNIIEYLKNERSHRDTERKIKAKKKSEEYGLPEYIFVTKMYADGKKRDNAKCDPSLFYYSYLVTTLEDSRSATTTKVGSSKRPICKLLYHHEQFLRGRAPRNTNPRLFKFELFIGPFLSEDDSRKFNKLWSNHRGAGPRREFAKKYARARGMLCWDVRTFQETDEIERQRKDKKRIRSRRYNCM